MVLTYRIHVIGLLVPLTPPVHMHVESTEGTSLWQSSGTTAMSA